MTYLEAHLHDHRNISHFMNGTVNEEITQKQQVINDLNSNLNITRNNNEKLREKVKSLKRYHLRNINPLNTEQLNKLEQRMEENILKIRKRKQRLIDDKLLCMVCMENRKNVLIQGCNHFDICHQCANNLQRKICPRCQAPFQNVLKVNNV